MRFGERLQELRQQAGLSQPELATASGLPVGSIRHYEQGRREPYWQVVFKLASALGVSSEAFAVCIENATASSHKPAGASAPPPRANERNDPMRCRRCCRFDGERMRVNLSARRHARHGDAMARARRHYSEEERASALAALAANGGNIKRTASPLGISEKTLNNWAKGIRHSESAKVGDQKKGKYGGRHAARRRSSRRGGVTSTKRTGN